jgi:hypothetical protein
MTARLLAGALSLSLGFACQRGPDSLDDSPEAGAADAQSAGDEAVPASPVDDAEAGGPDESDSALTPVAGDDGAVLPGADFAARCAAPGVLVCRGFDSDDELTKVSAPGMAGGEADSTGSMKHMTIDRSIKTSGAGALRFEIVGKTTANHSGAFRQPMGRAFGPDSTFYAQLRLRLSRAFVETNWDSTVASYPKIVLFHHSSATCNDIEWTQVMNSWYANIATMYTHCGQSAPGQYGGDQMYFQEGDYTCKYGADYAAAPGCFKYPADEWVTFTYQATVGKWGEPNTHLQAWVARAGQPDKQWINDSRFTLQADGASVVGFDSVYLTTYMTAKKADADHPTAYAWYDELIVSTQPIAVPR